MEQQVGQQEEQQVKQEQPSKSRWKRGVLRVGRDVLIFLVLALIVSTVMGRLRAPDLPEQAPAFALKTLDGKTVSLESLRGKTVVVNFWATWCAPCRAEVPMLSQFARSHPDIPVLGIAVDGKRDALAKAAKDLGIDYPVLIGTRDVVKAYGATTVPTTVIVNADGGVESVHVGLITTPQLWWATW